MSIYAFVLKQALYTYTYVCGSTHRLPIDHFQNDKNTNWQESVTLERGIGTGSL